MATRRRSATPQRATPQRATAQRPRATRRSAAQRETGGGFDISPATARSLVGLTLLVVGAVTLIALLLPASGLLNGYVEGLLRPAFGKGAWLLPALLLVAGVFVERAPNVGNGWGVTALGGLLVFLGGLGLLHLVSRGGSRPADLVNGGGAVGAVLSTGLTNLISAPGATVVLLGIVVAGLLLLFNLTVRGLFRPVARGGRALATIVTAPVRGRSGRHVEGEGGADDSGEPAGPAELARRWSNGAERAEAGPAESSTLGRRRGGEQLELPEPMPSPAPVSQTVWASPPSSESPRGVGASATMLGERERLRRPGGTGEGASAQVDPRFPDASQGSGEGRDGETGARPSVHRAWDLPGVDLLEAHVPAPAGTARLDHDRNRRIIEEKLRSFQIPASVTGTNTGPVVTQYEVKPDVRVKLSRIEGLADDLAMALAARSIRIEAPIPGRDVVGIEIPNHSSEVVAFRRLVEDARMMEATGKLTFALGRDVSGKPYAVDLAKMPHLLIAGATGSGKSVCVNALITSLLMRARPDEVRLVVVDLKRVELAAYDGLPHLLTSVIVEAGHARAALNWAVNQMESRYKALAARGERNIAAFNASPRIGREERLPYIVIVIDELADLIMREGRKIEDPVVKIAQKARAVGIHLVLATQRPSVNVVTGLIKANVPSRIAFAMASNVDSRTVLDQPGAEDLIGRGDMLYGPADLPRPVRLQGVFVSDAEVRAVTDHWREQAPEPDYDPELLAAESEDGGDGGGEFAWLARLAEDDLTPRAAELVMQTGKASTSMMQTKLKVGFNRASRLMEELERFGIVGPQDPRNPAVPRHVYGPDNWIRGAQDVDDPL